VQHMQWYGSEPGAGKARKAVLLDRRSSLVDDENAGVLQKPPNAAKHRINKAAERDAGVGVQVDVT